MLKLTIVASDAVIDNTKLLVEFTDGSFKVYPLSYGDNGFNTKDVKWKTHEQIATLVCNFNQTKRIDVNVALHNSKVSRLGWDYAKRGY